MLAGSQFRLRQGFRPQAKTLVRRTRAAPPCGAPVLRVSTSPYASGQAFFFGILKLFLCSAEVNSALHQGSPFSPRPKASLPEGAFPHILKSMSDPNQSRKVGDPVNESLLLLGSVILICILLNRFLEKIPVPSLLIFIALGMLFGENGLLKISFDDYAGVNAICSVCLVFIMFYGGFGTNLRAARPVLLPSVLLSTLGVAGTAGAVAVFAHWALGLPWLQCFLVGAVISSTDAASVFSILRSKNLALKYHTDSLLELESGSNDPMSYMLTAVAIALLDGQSLSIPLLLAQQLTVGVVCGGALGWLAVKLLHRQLLPSQQSHTVFLIAVMLLSYALPGVLGGNGYLSVYLCGIWIGNAQLPQKKYLVHFFDVLTHVSQVLIFFLLGLLVTPAQLPSVILPALALMLCLTLAARPLVTLLLLAPFRAKVEQMALVAWSGLRGAASIVFAIAVVLSGVETTYNLFNLVFCMVLLSIAIQGTLLPAVAQKLSMIDPTADVLRTFNDYQEDSDIHFIKLHVDAGHPWCGQSLSQLRLPGDLLVAMIVRGDGVEVPTGDTVLEPGDLLVLAARSFEGREHLALVELVVEGGHRCANQALAQIPQAHAHRVILVKRGVDTLIPTGSTVIQPGDILVMAQSARK